MNPGVDWRKAPRAQFAVVGDPISHSWSPVMQTAALRSLGRPDDYLPIHIPLDDFAEAIEHLRNLGYYGVNCTVPLKEAAWRWAQIMDPESHAYGAINTLRLPDRAGTNTDAPGFIDTLDELNIPPPGPVLVLGAGGTARALCRALYRAGYAIRIHNRTRSKAERLLDEISVAAEILDHPAVRDHRLILNTTSAGLSGETLDIAWGKPAKGVVAYDVVYRQELTPFLSDAKLAGCRVIDGRAMLVAQGARSLEWWLDVIAPRDVMLRALP
ncbi:MAG: shikimate dehydrogenase [Chthonomonas sp.]|nr:shikimate dehydrogenase [Chthonomonas sp.]